MNISADRTHPCGFTPTAMRFHLMLLSQIHISVLECKPTGGCQRYTSAKIWKVFSKNLVICFFWFNKTKVEDLHTLRQFRKNLLERVNFIWVIARRKI